MNTLFEGGGWKVVQESAPLPDGRTKTVARVYRADGAHIIAFKTPDTILMLREFRPFFGGYIWMLPSGKVDKETDIEAAAQRELQEETGYRADSIKHLWTVNYSESVGWQNHIFEARELHPDPLPQDEDELIEVHEMSIEEALEKIHNSPKVHMTSAYALMRYLREKK